MDTNEKKTPPERQPEVRPHAPQMDGVSAGGRPRRPVPRQQAENMPGKTSKKEGETAPRRRQPQQARPAGAAEGQRRQPPRKSSEESARKAPAEARQNRPPRKPQSAAGKKPQRNTGDSGYQPYRRAGQRRKAQRSDKLRTFFSNRNPVLVWFERIRYNKDSFAEESDIAKQRQARREAEAEKRRRRQNRFNTPAVIYTQPAAFNRDKLIVQLISVLSVVIAMMIGLSVFFKVGRITVSGAETYQPWTIVENSGISKGDNLLTFSRAKAVSQILANCPYVKDVRIGIKLPDTVNIEIVESDVVYAIKDEQGTW